MDILCWMSKVSFVSFFNPHKVIIMKRNPFTYSLMFFVFYSTLLIGQGQLRGLITDNDGQPLIGANILVEGTQNGTTTDFDGQYELSGVNSESVLLFSYTGMESKSEVVGNRTVINVQLQSLFLQEIVVTALGISREKQSLGYSVGEVDGDQLRQVSQDNVLNSLASKVPGLTISQTSGTGSSVNVLIRGLTSLTTDNQPLFVVDGVPLANSVNNIGRNGDRNEVDYGNAIADINPDDIESISVLKGPSAAALYGSRAGNGVILITTKSGKGKDLGVSFSTSNIFERPGKLLDFHYKYASGERNPVLDEGSAYWGGPALDVGNKAVQWNSPTDANGVQTPTELRSYPDNMRDFLQTGVTSNNNLSFSNSGDKGHFRVSFSNMTHRGMIPNSDLYRNALSTSIEHELIKNLTVTSNFSFGRTNSNDRPATASRGANALQSVYTWPHVNVRDMENYWVEGRENIEQLRPSTEGDNPYFIAYALTNAFKRDRLYGNLKLQYQITPTISFYVRHGLDVFNETRETKIPFNYSRANKGGYYLTDINFQESNSDFMASFNKSAGLFDVNFSAGGNYMRRTNQDNSIFTSNRSIGLIVPGIFNTANINRDNLGVSNALAEKAIYSLYALASIGFDHKLYLDITGRNDWSSTLPASNRSYFYPSVSLSWLLNETFDLPSAFSLLKLRAGWAQVGNDTDPYRLTPTLSTGNYNGLTTTSVPATLLNPQLKPEIATSTEFGLDVNLWKNKVRFEATYYNMQNENQIFSIALPQSSGYSGKIINAGLIESSGWEIALGLTPVSGNITWDVNFNLTKNKTILKELTEGKDFIDLWQDNDGGAFTFVGEEIGNLYSAGYARVMDPSSPYYRWPVLDNNGGWQELPNDRKNRINVGNFNPDFIMGMQTNLTYKRFSLSASFDWRNGGEFQSYTYRYGESDWKSQRQIDNLIPGGQYSQQELIDLLKSDPDKYIIPQNGNFPRVGGHTQESGGFYYDDNGGAVAGYDGAFVPGVIQTAGQDTPNDFSDDQYSEHLYPTEGTLYPITDTYPWSFNEAITFDASYIKLREIALTYRVPKFAGTRNASISIFSRNIMLWTKSKIGIDPERAFQAVGSAQGDTQLQFRQGIELQNVMPWTSPIGFKLNFDI